MKLKMSKVSKEELKSYTACIIKDVDGDCHFIVWLNEYNGTKDVAMIPYMPGHGVKAEAIVDFMPVYKVSQPGDRFEWSPVPVDDEEPEEVGHAYFNEIKLEDIRDRDLIILQFYMDGKYAYDAYLYNKDKDIFVLLMDITREAKMTLVSNKFFVGHMDKFISFKSKRKTNN